MQQRGHDWRPLLGNAFIAIGLLMLVGVGGAWGWEQWQGQRVRDQLRAEPTVDVAALPATLSGQATVAVAAATPGQAQTAAATPRPTATGTANTPATPQPSQTPLSSPTSTNTPALTATPAPSATPVPRATPVPGTKPARILIPSLSIDKPVTDMTWRVTNTAAGPESEWQIPEYSAGHAVNSALLGEQGNVVISGHNNIYGRVFMAISQAWPPSGAKKIDAVTEQSDILNGHKITVIGADGRSFNYAVTGFYRVQDSGVPLGQRLDNAKWIDQTDRAQLTLTTCWPPWSNTHRLIVLAEPVQ